jgi:hypothetical protein
VGRDESADSSGPATNATAPIYAQPLCNGGVVCSPSAFAGAKCERAQDSHLTERNRVRDQIDERQPTPASHMACAAVEQPQSGFEIEGRGFTEFFSAATDKCASLLLAMLIVTGSGLACSDRPLTFPCPSR